MNWIRVDEALPNEYMTVWAYDEELGVLKAFHSPLGWYSDNRQTTLAYPSHVTHWMPLIKPEPPL